MVFLTISSSILLLNFQAEITCWYSLGAICQETQSWEETLQNYYWYYCWASKKCSWIEGGLPKIRRSTKGWRNEVSYPQVAWGKSNWTGLQLVAEEHNESVNTGVIHFHACQRKQLIKHRRSLCLLKWTSCFITERSFVWKKIHPTVLRYS